MKDMLSQSTQDLQALRGETALALQTARGLVRKMLQVRDDIARVHVGDAHYERMREAALETISNTLDEAVAEMDHTETCLRAACEVAEHVVSSDLKKLQTPMDYDPTQNPTSGYA
jgi:hypothetical protein